MASASDSREPSGLLYRVREWPTRDDVPTPVVTARAVGINRPERSGS